MVAHPCRALARDARSPRNGLAVCELLAAFTLTVALVMLLIPTVPTAAGGDPPTPTAGRHRLFDALMNLHSVLSGDVVEACDQCFHPSADTPVIVDVFLGGDTEANVAPRVVAPEDGVEQDAACVPAGGP